jgi:xanthine dehydrogenase iron-sulfur cluster and FAD-binding subunit A
MDAIALEKPMWKNYIQPTRVEQVLEILAERGESARIVAGGTDLILEMEAGVREGIDTLIDITRIPDLDRICLNDEDVIHLGPMVTHNQCAASKLIREFAFPLAQAAWSVGAPQIRNRGTVAGNLITASPANDTIPPLMALGAEVTLRSKAGERVVPISEFYTGVRKIVMEPDEMLADISFPVMDVATQRGAFYKVGLRRTQAISVVNLAVILTFVDDRVAKAALTFGSVAPTVIHAKKVEKHLVGKKLDEVTILEAMKLVRKDVKPIGDLRGSADYRRYMAGVITKRLLQSLADNTQVDGFPEHPILLRKGYQKSASKFAEELIHNGEQPIETKINGKTYSFANGHQKSLLRLLREDALLTGTKEGCAEGECGACTVYLDGVAVMSCLVPAPRAHGAEILTIEGLSKDGELHPVQQAFIDQGAVQCGYCTPGFLMSGAMLLEEKPNPTPEDIRQAITGNLCRCTGYYKIVEAIQLAGEKR